VMLSEETAIGKHPVEAVLMMNRIARAAEAALDSDAFENIPLKATTSDAISHAAHLIAEDTGADAIIAPTWSGSTACRVSRFRPKRPILASTPNPQTLDFLSLCWGVVPLKISRSRSADEMIRQTVHLARKHGLLKTSQTVVIIGGMPLEDVGKTTTFIRVERI
jgi:pyruvate kinase